MTYDALEEQYRQQDEALYIREEEKYNGFGTAIIDYDGAFRDYEDPADYETHNMKGRRL